MNIAGIAKSHQTNSVATGKASSKKEWKLSDSLREKITEYAREDVAQNVYMGNKFLTLRKSEVAKVAPDRAGILGVPADLGEEVKAGIKSIQPCGLISPIRHRERTGQASLDF